MFSSCGSYEKGQRVDQPPKVIRSDAVLVRMFPILNMQILFVYYETTKRELNTKSDGLHRGNLQIFIIIINRTGTPKDNDEVNRRDVCECDG